MVLTITIGPRKEGICTADGRHMTVVTGMIRRGRKLVRLNDMTDLGHVDDVAFEVKSRFRRRKIDLCDEVRQGVCNFLNGYHARQDMSFSCYQFANLVHGVPQHTCHYLFKHWDVESAVELIPGGTVFLLDLESQMFRHAAIYLGYGLFVSVYGAGGDLEFSTLEDMVREFGGVAAMALPKTATA